MTARKPELEVSDFRAIMRIPRAPSQTRTDTERILSPLPLPIGLWGLPAGTPSPRTCSGCSRSRGERHLHADRAALDDARADDLPGNAGSVPMIDPRPPVFIQPPPRRARAVVPGPVPRGAEAPAPRDRDAAAARLQEPGALGTVAGLPGPGRRPGSPHDPTSVPRGPPSPTLGPRDAGGDLLLPALTAALPAAGTAVLLLGTAVGALGVAVVAGGPRPGAGPQPAVTPDDRRFPWALTR